MREAIFDILGSRGGVEDLRVMDLFCGSGAMGLEALSRGAATVTFVDHDPRALDAVRRNLAASGLDGPAATVVRGSLPAWLSGVAPVDLVLCDPPYAFGPTDWTELLGRLPAATAVLESAASVPEVAGWEIVKSRRYGGTLVTVIEPASDRPSGRVPARPGAETGAAQTDLAQPEGPSR